MSFVLRTVIRGGQMAYLGIGGDIDGQINPTLEVRQGEVFR